MEPQNQDLQRILELNNLIHCPTRLAILIFILPRKNNTFSLIKNVLGLTGGNLSIHLKKLEDAGLIEMNKAFVDAKPITIISITDHGRFAVTEYASNLSSVLRKTLEKSQ